MCDVCANNVPAHNSARRRVASTLVSPTTDRSMRITSPSCAPRQRGGARHPRIPTAVHFRAGQKMAEGPAHTPGLATRSIGKANIDLRRRPKVDIHNDRIIPEIELGEHSPCG